MRLNKENALTFSEALRNAFRDPEERNNDFQKVEIDPEYFDGTILEMLSAMLVIVQQAADMPDLTMYQFIYMLNQIYFQFNKEAAEVKEAADERKSKDRPDGSDEETEDLPEES